MISITGGLQAMYNSNMREKTPLELEQELSQAKCRIRDLLKSETEYKLENERLNNIINKIEKYIELEIEHCYNEGSTIEEFNKICDISSKLQELKENK